MNLAHLHIVLNHVPSLGTIVAVGLLIASMVKKSDRLQKSGLVVLVLMTIVALPTYISGNAAQGLLADRTDIPPALIEAHQNSAMLTLVLLTITGSFAWFGLWQFRRYVRPSSMTSRSTLILSLLTMALILRTASFGGLISHPEIREDQIAEVASWQAPFSGFVWGQSWVWPTAETLHFIGMTLVFGVALMVNLRMLGMMKSIPFSALHRLLPLGILGFVLNVITGMVFFIASPELYSANTAFVVKIFCLVLAGITVIYFTVSEEPWKVGPDKEAPLMAKIVAVCTTTFVFGAMYFGRMIPFLVN